jgi:hypothetical protein
MRFVLFGMALVAFVAGPRMSPAQPSPTASTPAAAPTAQPVEHGAAPSARADDTRDGRALFDVGERSLEPILCFDVSQHRYRDCISYLHEGDRVRVDDRDVALGQRERALCGMCGEVDSFAATIPEPREREANRFAPRFAVWPPGADLDIQRVADVRDPPTASVSVRRRIAAVARAYLTRPVDQWSEPCSDTAARVRPQDVYVSQRVDVDLDADGIGDQLYVASVEATDACPKSWTALVLAPGVSRSEMTALAEGEGALIEVTGTFEIDGTPPRELMYQFGYEGTYDRVGRIRDGALWGMWSNGCDP